MGNLGRPSKRAVAERKRDAVYLALKVVAADRHHVKEIAERLGVGVDAIRADLETAASGTRDTSVLDNVARQLDGVETASGLVRFLKRLGRAVALRRIAVAEASYFQGLAHELRMTLPSGDAKRDGGADRAAEAPKDFMAEAVACAAAPTEKSRSRTSPTRTDGNAPTSKGTASEKGT